MTTITYCKGLPTNVDELTPIGYSKFELFLGALSDIFHAATIETVNLLLNLENKFNQSSWNTHLQKVYGISKRHAHGVIANAQGKVNSAKECRNTHIQQLKSKLKSAINWVSKSSRKLKLARKFYAKKNWVHSQTNCNFPLSSSLQDKKTNWYRLRFNIHHKKRYIFKLQNRIEYLLAASIRVKVARGDVFVVGSKNETYGNQICQWNGNTIKFRVPYCLESRFGKYVTSDIGNFNRNINRLPDTGAKTWHFYRQNHRWVVAVSFTPSPVKQVSRSIQYGCVGIDFRVNASSLGRIISG